MSLISRMAKLGRAAILGWMVPCVALAPIQVNEAIRNAGWSVAKSTPWFFAELVGLSLLLWIAITLAISCYFVFFFVSPFVWLLPPERIVASRVLWVAVNALFGFTLIALRAHVWTAFEHDGVGFTNFRLWVTYSTVFFGITAETYTRQQRRSLAAAG